MQKKTENISGAGGAWLFLRTPIFGPLLADGFWGRFVMFGGMGYGVLATKGYAFLFCPIHRYTGIDCPSCGLTRSVVATLHGDLLRAFGHHAFGPLLVALGMVGLVACVLPNRWRLPVALWVSRCETRFYVPGLLVALLVMYWVGRYMLGVSPSQ